MIDVMVKGPTKDGTYASFKMTVPELPQNGDLIITEQEPSRWRRWLVTQRAFYEHETAVYVREIDDYGL